MGQYDCIFMVTRGTKGPTINAMDPPFRVLREGFKERDKMATFSQSWSCLSLAV